MIGPSWLVGPITSRGRKRTFAYTRMRSRSRRQRKSGALRATQVQNEIVIFDHVSSELPVATARPREPRAHVVALAEAVRRWFAARWSWLRPRTVPVLVAAAGTVFVLVSADYLSHAHGEPPPSAPKVDTLTIELGPAHALRAPAIFE